MYEHTSCKRKAVAYMRFSSDNQDENSITYQRTRIYTYGSVHNIEIVGEYIDRACTGTNDKRDDFQRMIRDAQQKPPWDLVLVFSLSRYFRNDSEALHYRNVLNDHGIEIISVTQGFDKSPEGLLMETITFAMDSYFSKANALHTHSGMLEKAKESMHCGGVPPLGYDLDENKKLIINPKEAEVVRRIFKMVEQNYSYNKIAEILNREGYRTKRGSLFKKTSFHELLRQEKYTGVYTWNRCTQKNSRHQRNSHACKALNEQVRIENGCPMIITPEQFQRVQEKLALRAGGKASSKSRRNYMLSGLKILKCANCGSYMVGHARTSHGKTYTVYTCPKHKTGQCTTKEIRTRYLDWMVARLLVKDAYNRNDWEAILNKFNHPEELEVLNRKKRGVEKAIDNLVKAIEQNGIGTLSDRFQELTAEKENIEHRINEISDGSTLPAIPQNIKHICTQLGRRLMSAEDPETKCYIQSLVDEILIDNTGATIKLNIA